MKMEYNIDQYFTRLQFSHNKEMVSDRDHKKFPHYPLWNQAIRVMKLRGWKIERIPKYEKEYKSISARFRQGIKGDLKVKLEINLHGFCFEFYQDLVCQNSYGGLYDFDKFTKMPYKIKLMFLNETSKIGKFFESKGCFNKSDKKGTAEGEIIKHTNSSFHKRITALTDMDSVMSQSDRTYNSKDRDGKIIHCGEIKYFRDYHGRLARGRVWHNINNMWWVVISKNNFTNIASFSLFDPLPAEFQKRREKRHKIPQKVQERKDWLSKMSIGELKGELKRRKEEESESII